MVDRRSEEGASGDYFPLGGVYATEGDVPAREAGFHPVLYLLCMEEFELRADGIFQRNDGRGSVRIFPAELVAEHAGYSERISAAQRARGIHDPADSGGNAQRELRDLWARV